MRRIFPDLRTARFVLAWFVAFVMVAGIAPALHAQTADTLCTPGATADKSLPPVHKLECPQCAGIAAPPPPAASLVLPSFAPLARVLRPAASTHVAGVPGAPLPARGPPHFS